tara:strand:+ start:663 stop:935 length:273 start_codon:yes stop_codon:yes gene_type:complete
MKGVLLSEVIEAGFPNAISAFVIATPPNDNHEGFRVEIALADLELAGKNLELVEARIIAAVQQANAMIAQREEEAKSKEKLEDHEYYYQR